MAKHDTKEDKAKVKFRFFDFELEGSNATLETAVRTMATTLARRDGSVSTAKALKQAVTALPNGHVAEMDDEFVDDNEPDGATSVEPEGPARSRTAAKRVVEQPKLLDIDFRSASVSLQDYVASHQVGDAEWKRYLAIAKWFKEHMAVNAVTIDHIFTGYRTMNWKVPTRVRQPLIDATGKKGWFRRAGKGNYAITHIGEDQITMTGSTE